MPKMRETDLRSLIGRRIQQAIAYDSGTISSQREQSLNLYLAKPRGDEAVGRSSVVTTEVQDVIESIMPEMMEIFAAGEELGKCEPIGPEDEAYSEQATEYVNFIWSKDNPGFEVSYDWIKDALTQKNGFIKIAWDNTPVTRQTSYTGLSIVDVQTLDSTEGVKIVAHKEREATKEEIEQYPDGSVHDVDIERTIVSGRIKVMACPPEEILVGKRTIDLDDAMFVCHRTRKTRSELKEEGYSDRVLDKVVKGDASDLNLEMITRDQQSDNVTQDEDDGDKASQSVWVYECYTKVDFDGDGKAELRQITVAGNGYELLENEEIDEQPIVSITPIRMPHQLFGRAVTDLVQDIQDIKTTVTRQLLDNMYQVNNARSLVYSSEGRGVNVDDYTTNRIGGVVRTNMPVGESLMPIVTAPLGPQAFGILEYLDSVRETRTGITRYNQGMDANSLNKTASGIQQIISRAQRRMLLIARLFAETGFKRAFKKINRLTIRHQDRPRIIRLRNEWVPVDPRGWNADMDININVGLGYGTKEQQAAMLERLLMTQLKAVELQQGISGPIVTGKNLYAALKLYPPALGYKGPDQFFSDPDDPQTPKPQPQPDPKMVEAQGKLALKEKELQMGQQFKQQEAQLEKDQSLADMHLERMKADNEIKLKWAEFQAEMQMERMKFEHEMQIKTMEAQVAAALRTQESAAKQSAIANGETR